MSVIFFGSLLLPSGWDGFVCVCDLDVPVFVDREIILFYCLGLLILFAIIVSFWYIWGRIYVPPWGSHVVVRVVIVWVRIEAGGSVYCRRSSRICRCAISGSSFIRGIVHGSGFFLILTLCLSRGSYTTLGS